MNAQWDGICHAARPPKNMKSLAQVLLIIVLLTGCSPFSEPHPTTLFRDGIRLKPPLQTWKALREQNVVMQQFDYSCGASALATLMRYYFQDEVTESEVLEDITGHLDETTLDLRKENGFSLLDLKNYAERRGYQALGAKLKLSTLPKLRGPILVYLEPLESRHFAILRGLKEDRVFLADPSRGNLRMSVTQFSQEWSGIALILGKKNFEPPAEYPLAIRTDELNRNELSTVRRGVYTSW